ncbi:MAG: Npun_F0296 family exosortase-dependent surface protein [Janthinobacterium lividum]
MSFATVRNSTGENSLPEAGKFYSCNGAAFGDANGVDTTNYIAVGVGSRATVSMPTAVQSLGLLWGSVDAYNTLTFFSDVNGTGTNVGSLTGADLPSTGSNGNQTAAGTA